MSTTSDLPNDLLAFLRAGRQLEYDAANSEIGSIMLKRDVDLAVTTIRTFPGCQSIIHDPYFKLNGLYQSEVYDLVAESEHYDPEGLLCWIVAVKRFGCIDPEHGDVITFPDVTWADIVANPLPYLVAQWGDDYDVAVRVLPWLYFPFKLQETDTPMAPYGSQCPAHGVPITVQPLNTRLIAVLRDRKNEDWFQAYQTAFPCSGLPVNDDELLCCSTCRVAEDAWLERMYDWSQSVDASPNAHGWVKCPGCGIRFLTTDSRVFADSSHLVCGQKINVVP